MEGAPTFPKAGARIHGAAEMCRIMTQDYRVRICEAFRPTDPSLRVARTSTRVPSHTKILSRPGEPPRPRPPPVSIRVSPLSPTVPSHTKIISLPLRASTAPPPSLHPGLPAEHHGSPEPHWGVWDPDAHFHLPSGDRGGLRNQSNRSPSALWPALSQLPKLVFFN